MFYKIKYNYGEGYSCVGFGLKEVNLLRADIITQTYKTKNKRLGIKKYFKLRRNKLSLAR